jgi:hypothetical protein
MKTQKPARGGLLNVSIFHGAGIFLILLMALVFSCTQSPIFFTISQEVELREPLIKGTPTNIVAWNDGVYAANFTSLHCYKRPAVDQDPEWVSIGNLPPGQIWGLAATEAALYLLTSNGLFKTDTADAFGLAVFSPNAMPIAGDDAKAYPLVQNIYGNSKRLFAGSSDGNPGAAGTDYAILYDNDGTLSFLKGDVHLLSGTAFDGTTHYLATKGSGIFVVDEPAPATPLSPLPSLGNSGDPVTDSGSSSITGIIYCGSDTAAGADVAAIGRSGKIMAVTTAGITVREKAIGYSARDALALWRQPPIDLIPVPTDPNDPDYPDNQSPELLLAGIQGSLTSTTQTYNNGYREIVLTEKTGGGAELPVEVDVYSPGESPTPSISNRERYSSSLGQYPVNYLFQVPYRIDENMPIFASTQQEGLWSYRDHGDGELYWNAE